MLSIKIDSFSCWNFRNLHDNSSSKFTLLKSLFIFSCQLSNDQPIVTILKSIWTFHDGTSDPRKKEGWFSCFLFFSCLQWTLMLTSALKKFHNNFLQLLHRYLENNFCIETCKIVAISLCLKRRIILSLAKLKKEHSTQLSTLNSFRDPTFTLSEFIKSLKLELKTWRKVFWRIWGICHVSQCSLCEKPFQVDVLTFQ